jgi:hypothetical protein
MTRAPRWRTLLGRPDDVLAALVADAALATRTRRAELSRWSAISGLPDGEVLASPSGARMIALGLEAGATTVHHELRPLLPWHRSVRPEGAVTDPKHGLWIRGALRTGKYEEFCAEDPFTSHHPEHSAKWAPHEMLHRAVGFFARADASGFSRYLGARLNELLPVATWYGLELARRLDREGPFDRVREGSEIEAPRERALWLGESERSLRARARRAAPLLRWTLERTDRELAAIDEEIASGRIVASPDVHLESLPDVRLDASADALAYVHAHARRLESPAIAQILDALAPQCVPTVATLRARVDRVLDRLLFGRIALDPAHFEARIRANVVLDVLLRAAITEPSVDLRELVARGRRLVARRLSTGALIRFVEDVRARLEGQWAGSVRARSSRSASCRGPSSRRSTRVRSRMVSRRSCPARRARSVRVVATRSSRASSSRADAVRAAVVTSRCASARRSSRSRARRARIRRWCSPSRSSRVSSTFSMRPPCTSPASRGASPRKAPRHARGCPCGAASASSVSCTTCSLSTAARRPHRVSCTSRSATSAARRSSASSPRTSGERSRAHRAERSQRSRAALAALPWTSSTRSAC